MPKTQGQNTRPAKKQVADTGKPQLEQSEIALPAGARLSDVTSIVDTLRKEYVIAYGHQSEERNRRLYIPDSTKVKPFSDHDFRQYLTDFKADVLLTGARLQRLQLKLLSLLLKGELAKTGAAGKPPKEVREFNRQFLPSPPLRVDHTLSDYDVKLMERVHDAQRNGDPISAQQRVITIQLLDTVKELRIGIVSLLEQQSLFPSIGARTASEEKLQGINDQYRQLLKLHATVLELESWFSPTYGSSAKGRKGAGQIAKPFESDYQRNHMQEMRDFERTLQKYLTPNASECRGHWHLFNTGLNALHAILKCVDQLSDSSCEQRSGPKVILKIKNLYFEVDPVIENYCKSKGITLKEFEPSDLKGIAHAIIDDKPIAVVVAPICNNMTLDSFPVYKLISLICSRKFDTLYREEPLATKSEITDLEGDGDELTKKFGRPGLVPTVNLIIDNTAAGRLSSWQNHPLEPIPPYLRIFAFESLIKFAQDGQELIQGAVAMEAGFNLSNGLAQGRRREGLMPPEAAFRRLSQVLEPDLIDLNMIRHSRNALVLAEMLSGTVEQYSFIGAVHYPFLGVSSEAATAKEELKGGGAILTARINPLILERYKEDLFILDYEERGSRNDRAASIAKAYVETVLRLARSVGVELNAGTGFGFSASRIAVYCNHRERRFNVNELDSEPFIRIAAGTENTKVITLIGMCMVRAAEILGQATDRGCLWSVSEDVCRTATNLKI